MTTIICAVLGSSVISTIINQVFLRLDQKNRRDKVDRFLLLEAVERRGTRSTLAGKISPTNLKAFLECYDLYKALGGDGYADSMKKKVEALPIVEE